MKSIKEMSRISLWVLRALGLFSVSVLGSSVIDLDSSKGVADAQDSGCWYVICFYNNNYICTQHHPPCNGCYAHNGTECFGPC